eukprot:PhF_6_TR7060/c0_g1_i1/m.10656/K08582/CAPN15; calpain-15
MTEQLVHETLYVTKTSLADGTERVTYSNKGTTRQYTVKCTFTDPNGMKPLGDTTKVEDGAAGTMTFSVTVYPSSIVDFVEGKWKGMKRSLQSSAPDEKYLKQQTEKTAKELDESLALMKSRFKDVKHPSEYGPLCDAAGVPFIDVEFLPTDGSLSRGHEKKLSYPWARPRDFLEKGLVPDLFVHKIEPNDIDQGKLGNCYLLCSLAGITENPEHIISMFQRRSNPTIGLYRCDLVKNGWWRTVTVDDFFPIHGGAQVFARNREEPNELWVSIVEKSYAKMYGSYSAIGNGDASYALHDLTGFPAEKFKEPFDFAKFEDWSKKGYLLTLGTPGKDTSMGGTDPHAAKYNMVGLQTGHAYTLLRAITVNGHQLCKIRNPWGNGFEWNGDWGDDSELWTPELIRITNFEKAPDGIFWMCFKDVCEWFKNGCVCYLNPNGVQIRVALEVQRGTPNAVMKITVKDGAHGKATIPLRVAVHQTDMRGLSPSEASRRPIAGFRCNLHDSQGQKLWGTHEGNFMAARDVTGCGEVPIGTHYLTVDAFQGASCPCVVVLHVNHTEVDNFEVEFLQNEQKSATAEAPKQADGSPAPIPFFRFKPAEWTQPATVTYQTKYCANPFQETSGERVVICKEAKKDLIVPSLEHERKFGSTSFTMSPKASMSRLPRTIAAEASGTFTTATPAVPNATTMAAPKAAPSQQQPAAAAPVKLAYPTPCIVQKPGGIFGLSKSRFIEMISATVLEYREREGGPVCGTLTVDASSRITRSSNTTLVLIGTCMNAAKPKKDQYTFNFQTSAQCEAWESYLKKISH